MCFCIKDNKILEKSEYCDEKILRGKILQLFVQSIKEGTQAPSKCGLANASPCATKKIEEYKLSMYSQLFVWALSLSRDNTYLHYPESFATLSANNAYSCQKNKQKNFQVW